MSSIIRSLFAAWEKNLSELQATFSGRIFHLLKTADSDSCGPIVPIFIFHSVEPQLLERQLRYLTENGYILVGADELLLILKGKKKKGRRTVALTFDDATGSFWTTAFPLLKKYMARAILFVIPGLVLDDNRTFPNLEDVWGGRCSIEEIKKREEIQPLCTWSELIEMHQSGFVDVQSHSLTHSRINVSAKVVDFIHPKFDPYFYGNVNIPINRNENPESPSREFVLGQPVYRNSSRFSGYSRFLEDTSIGEHLAEYVKINGEIDFFKRFNWRRDLKKKYQSLSKRHGTQNEFEDFHQTKDAIQLEMIRSKEILERCLAGKKIRHFCYPWFQGSELSDKIAGESGYQAVYYGLKVDHDEKEDIKMPLRIRRISEEYLLCLPGQGRKSIFRVWIRKIFRFTKNFVQINRAAY